MKRYISILAALSFYGAHLTAMDHAAAHSPQGTEEHAAIRTDFSQKGEDSCTLITEDHVQFTVSQSLVMRLRYLEEQKALTSSLAPIHVTATNLEKVLIFLTEEKISPNLSIDQLIGMLATIDFLDIKVAKEPIHKALVYGASWENLPLLEDFFADSPVPHEDKVALMPLLAVQLRWNIAGIARWHKNQSIAPCYTFSLIEELIEATPGQLFQIVHFDKVHEKHCLDRGLDPMECCIIFTTKPNDAELQSHAALKALLEDDYECIVDHLRAKYKCSKTEHNDWEALVDEFASIVDGEGK